MTCTEAREHGSAFIDDALDAPARTRLEVHLAGCSECRRELERLAATVTLLRAVRHPRAPAGFVDRVLTAARPAPWYRRLAARVFLPLPAKLPLEGAALLMVAVLGVQLYRHLPGVEPFRDVPSMRAAARPATPRGAPAVRARDIEPRAKQPAAPERSPSRADQEPHAPAPVGPGQVAERRDPGPLGARPGETTEGAASNEPTRQLELANADASRQEATGDRSGSERALAELLVRAGGREVGRRPEPSATLVELVLPESSAADFARQIGRLPGLRVEHQEPAPPDVRITVRIAR